MDISIEGINDFVIQNELLALADSEKILRQMDAVGVTALARPQAVNGGFPRLRQQHRMMEWMLAVIQSEPILFSKEETVKKFLLHMQTVTTWEAESIQEVYAITIDMLQRMNRQTQPAIDVGMILAY